MSYDLKKRLIELIREKAYEKKSVILASGRKSDFYIDTRQVTLHPEGAHLTGKLIYQLIQSFDKIVEGVGGLTMGADPIATAVSLISYLEGKGIPAFIVRKEAKKHGLGLWIEGKKNLKDGANVVIVEDVITSGGSSIKACERALSEGLNVLAVITLVDREEGGREAVEAKGISFYAVVKKSDIVN